MAADRWMCQKPVVQGHERCQWPEGAVTCRLLDAGARLEPLRGVSFRIVSHTKLTKPPQNRPREAPHVCAGKTAALPANVDSWTKEDVIVWVRQEVGLGGVAAALAGASLGQCVPVLPLFSLWQLCAMIAVADSCACPSEGRAVSRVG